MFGNNVDGNEFARAVELVVGVHALKQLLYLFHIVTTTQDMNSLTVGLDFGGPICIRDSLCLQIDRVVGRIEGHAVGLNHFM